MKTPIPGSGHPAWCLGGHHCAMGEHRGQPVLIPGQVNAVATLVRADGRNFVEVNASFRLPDGNITDQAKAIWHVALGLARLRKELRRKPTPNHVSERTNHEVGTAKAIEPGANRHAPSAGTPHERARLVRAREV